MAKRYTKAQWSVIKSIVFLICLVPFAMIVYDSVNNQLGADPIQTLHFRTGDWALRFLLVTLTMTPLQLMFQSITPLRFRRMFGLFTFFYACLHFAVWLVLDQSLNIQFMMEDIPESPYIIVGLIAFTLLIPLAMTSTNAMMARLGQRWFQLHKLIYIVAVLGLIHFFWLTKLDTTEPIVYAIIFAILMMFRLRSTAILMRNKSTS